MKSVIILFLTLFIYAQHQQHSIEKNNPEVFAVKKQKKKLEQLKDNLTKVHERLTENSRSVLELNKKASENLTNNIYKIFMKGSLDIYNKITAPTNSILDLTNEVILNIVAEPALWKREDRFNKFIDINKASYYRNTKLKLMYESLGKVMSAPLKRFDDDMQPFAYTKPWWNEPDSEQDDETELITRKLNIVVNLSDKLYKRTEDELAKVRKERKTTIEVLKGIEKDLAGLKKEEAEKKAKEKEVEDWLDRVRKRHGITGDHDKPQRLQTFEYDPPEVKEKLMELAEENKKENQKREEEKRITEAKKKKYQQKLADAQVYVDSDCPRHVPVREPIVLIARAHPEEIKGTFKLFIDDKLIAESKKQTNIYKFNYAFKETGKYDMQVKLFIDGKYNDTYTDQLYAEENISVPNFSSLNVQSLNKKDSYDSSLEGTTKQIIKLPFCEYNAKYKNGEVKIEGFYYTPTGQKINYKSEPVSPETIPYAASGFLLTKSGTGYHFYKTTGGIKDKSKFIVTRMRGANVETIKKFEAAWMTMNAAQDLSTITIKYKTEKNGSEKEIILD